MDTNELDKIREALFTAMDEQRAADIAANETSQLLGQQKLMYSNDARGTLYSGQPTWERTQLATKGLTNLASIEDSYTKNKLQVWDNITSILDQVNSYNKAAAALAKASSNSGTSGASGSANQSFLELYNSLQGGN